MTATRGDVAAANARRRNDLSAVDLDAVRRDAVAVRKAFVDERVNDFIDWHDGEVSTAAIEECEARAYRRWREMYPALNGLLFPHLPEHFDEEDDA
jgi:hypothetical protein